MQCTLRESRLYNRIPHLSRTGRNLHSHVHEAPMTKKHFQVTGYGTVSTFTFLTAFSVLHMDVLLELDIGAELSSFLRMARVTSTTCGRWRCAADGEATLWRFCAAKFASGTKLQVACCSPPGRLSQSGNSRCLRHFLLEDLLTWSSEGSGFLCLVRGWEQVEVTCSPYLKETPSSQWNIEDHINPKCTINSAIAYTFCCCCFHCVISSCLVFSCVFLQCPTLVYLF